jgi:hypothetical protein
VGDEINYSSSAVDTLEIFFQMKTFWEQLNWPDVEEAFSFVGRIINVSLSGRHPYYFFCFIIFEFVNFFVFIVFLLLLEFFFGIF